MILLLPVLAVTYLTGLLFLARGVSNPYLRRKSPKVVVALLHASLRILLLHFRAVAVLTAFPGRDFNFPREGYDYSGKDYTTAAGPFPLATAIAFLAFFSRAVLSPRYTQTALPAWGFALGGHDTRRRCPSKLFYMPQFLRSRPGTAGEGMGMVFSRSHVGYFAPRDPWSPTPRSLTLLQDRRGLYSVDPKSEFEEFSMMNKGPYSFWTSVKYIFILSVMLWWIPTFGQMIAGYVGGRKAGNPWKAAGAAVFPVALIWTLALMAEATSAFPGLINLVALPAAAAHGLGQAIPILDPYIQLVVDYLTSFFIALKETVGMGLNGYLVTIIFAYIGGLIADQMSKEREVVKEEVPPVYETYQPPQLPYPRARPALAAGASGWYRVHRERYDHLRRIPVAPYGYDEVEEYYEPPVRPVQRRPVEPYPHQEYEQPRDRPAPREEPRRGRRLDKEELIRRLVERALREYDRSMRRDASHR